MMQLDVVVFFFCRGIVMVNVVLKAPDGSQYAVPLQYALKQSSLFQMLSENFSSTEEGENVVEVPCATPAALELFAKFVVIRADKDVPPPPQPLKSLDFSEASIPMEKAFFDDDVLQGKGMIAQQRLIDLMVVADFLQHEGLLSLSSAFLCCAVSNAGLKDLRRWSQGERPPEQGDDAPEPPSVTPEELEMIQELHERLSQL